MGKAVEKIRNLHRRRRGFIEHPTTKNTVFFREEYGISPISPPYGGVLKFIFMRDCVSSFGSVKGLDRLPFPLCGIDSVMNARNDPSIQASMMTGMQIVGGPKRHCFCSLEPGILVFYY
jgi:hypothetical protein